MAQPAVAAPVVAPVAVAAAAPAKPMQAPQTLVKTGPGLPNGNGSQPVGYYQLGDGGWAIWQDGSTTFYDKGGTSHPELAPIKRGPGLPKGDGTQPVGAFQGDGGFLVVWADGDSKWYTD